MIDYTKEFGSAAQLGGLRTTRETQVARTFKLVYGWMAAGLALSGAVAWYTAASGLWQRVLVGPGMWGLVIAELALVFGLSAAIHRIPVGVAYLLFGVYAALNGLTLSVVFIAYELSTVYHVFLVTAAMFGGMAVYGSVTKENLSGIGSFCSMALWGVIIASIVNIFLRSSGLDWALSFIGVLVFTGLTMYDAQKIKALAAQEGTLDPTTVSRLGILGALTLYLDFINLFLMLLRLFGGGRSRN